MVSSCASSGSAAFLSTSCLSSASAEIPRLAASAATSRSAIISSSVWRRRSYSCCRRPASRLYTRSSSSRDWMAAPFTSATTPVAVVTGALLRAVAGGGAGVRPQLTATGTRSSRTARRIDIETG